MCVYNEVVEMYIFFCGGCCGSICCLVWRCGGWESFDGK